MLLICFRADFVFVDVAPIPSRSLSAYLRRFVDEDGFDMTGCGDSSLFELAEYCKGDVRRALNELQGFACSMSGKSLPRDVLRRILFGDEDLAMVSVVIVKF
jgi:hypothetical protein